MANPIVQSLLGQKRKASLMTTEALPPFKKSNQDSLISRECCCNPNQEPPFLNITVREITSIFNINKKIGEGEFGTISLVTCHHKKLFAMKKLETFQGAFKYGESNTSNESNEILTYLKEINDIHIMKFYAKYLEEDIASASNETDQLTYIPRYLVFEYIEGFNLEQAFNHKHAMTENTIHYLMDQLFKIDLALTTYKIIHNDLHLRNIMYCVQSKMLKVTDFGKAQTWEQSKRETNKAIQHITLCLRLGIAIAHSLIWRVESKIQEEDMDIEPLIKWIESESESFQNSDEESVLAQTDVKFYQTNYGPHIPSFCLRDDPQGRRLLNKTTTQIIIWSKILYLIFCDQEKFGSYLNHFTIEKFLNFQQTLPPSNDDNLREIYLANRDIE